MAGLAKDTIGASNPLVRNQRGEEGEALISMALFDNYSDVIHDCARLDWIPEVKRGRRVMFMAVEALLDAVGAVWYKCAREEDCPVRPLFVITTDGMENTSRCYPYDHFRQMIERQKEKYG